jgi:NAD(P)-dependent dehydrogenase (short-subunit alcohol dehydrogenase family)
MSGKIALVTGANSGIGLEASVALARRGFTVVMACRDRARGEEAAKLAQERSGGKTEFLALDLNSLDSVRKAAAEFKSRHEELHVLLNNAGVFLRERGTTADGFEATLGVNHLGHFLLTKLLLERMKSGARVVNVSSVAHKSAKWDWDDVQLEKGWGGWRSYANSKLANVWFTRELARRAPPGVTTDAVHPGGVATNIFRRIPGPLRWVLSKALISPEQGAAPLVMLCVDDVKGTGRYFDKMKERTASAAARDDAAAKRFWELSETLAGK